MLSSMVALEVERSLHRGDGDMTAVKTALDRLKAGCQAYKEFSETCLTEKS